MPINHILTTIFHNTIKQKGVLNKFCYLYTVLRHMKTEQKKGLYENSTQ